MISLSRGPDPRGAGPLTAARTASSHIWHFALGYFGAYVPYAGLTKAFTTRGDALGGHHLHHDAGLHIRRDLNRLHDVADARRGPRAGAAGGRVVPATSVSARLGGPGLVPWGRRCRGGWALGLTSWLGGSARRGGLPARLLRTAASDEPHRQDGGARRADAVFRRGAARLDASPRGRARRAGGHRRWAAASGVDGSVATAGPAGAPSRAARDWRVVAGDRRLRRAHPPPAAGKQLLCTGQSSLQHLGRHPRHRLPRGTSTRPGSRRERARGSSHHPARRRRSGGAFPTVDARIAATPSGSAAPAPQGTASGAQVRHGA